ncbi:hypothetical protein ACJMK2_043447 [Sinanodonta woodiana]|uniref:Proton-coupled zinc antiporter SLC30A5 n=1 Tax=Sinanodonta woodiana TaxID=1069815 RepID=A0ABD3VXP4_SINWO
MDVWAHAVWSIKHSDLVVIAWASALFTSNGGGPAKMRAAMFFIMAIVTLLLFDHDEKLDSLADHDSDHKHYNFISYIFYHIINFIGTSDHKGGVVLVFLTLCLTVGYNNAAKKLSVDVGGAKRLHALSTFVQSLLLFPWAVIIYATMGSQVEISSWFFLLLPMTLVVLFVFTFDYYLMAVTVNHLQPPRVAIFGTYAMFASALFLSVTWNHPLMTMITSMNKLKEVITEDHVLSWGVLLSLGMFILATSILVGPARNTKGSFIGFSSAGMPLYSFTGEALQRTSHSIATVLKNGLKQILEDSDSRKIFYFLCINLGFTFVELVYGAWTNSLGLISDGFHMLFDCSALVMGLYAAVMSRWKATRIFSFGYDRVEVLSGFVNGLFLIVIGVFVFTEAMHRLFEPPEINTERLLVVSVTGLLVNLIGIVAFRSSHGHSHGGHGHSSHSDSLPTSQGHGHSHAGHGHSHASHGHGHSGGCEAHNTNMEGVFLHVLADTLGSVGVIISSLLIENFGWNIADPICSLFIATMIMLSVLPLLKETSIILLLRTPVDHEDDMDRALEKILSIEGIVGYREPHFWSHTSSKKMGSVHVQVSHTASEQRIIAQVTSVFKEIGVSHLTVQVEKEAYFQHLSGLCASYDQMISFSPADQTNPQLKSSTAIAEIKSI